MKKLFMGFVTAALLTVCLCVPAFAADAVSYPCAHLAAIRSSGPGPTVGLCYADGVHYFYCTQCNVFMSSVDVTGEDAPHLDSGCGVCMGFSSVGAGVLGSLPSSAPGVLPSITTLVTASIDWLTAFALCIISTPLFLIFVCCIFVGLGIGLIKRSIHL